MGEEIIKDLAVFAGAQLVGDEYSIYPSLRKSEAVSILGRVSSAKITKKECILKGVSPESELPGFKQTGE